MENPRTTDARDHDDHALIDSTEAGTSQQGSAGGNLSRDVTSRADLDAVEKPDNRERVTKQNDIDHAAEIRPDRARAG